MFTVISLKKLSEDPENSWYYDDIPCGRVETISKNDLVYRFAKASLSSLSINWIRAESREIGIILDADGTWYSANRKADELDLKQQKHKDSPLIVEKNGVKTYLTFDTNSGIATSDTPSPVIINNYDVSSETACREFSIRFHDDSVLCRDSSAGSEENVSILSTDFIQNEVHNKRYSRYAANIQLNYEREILLSMDRYSIADLYLTYCYSSNLLAFKPKYQFETDPDCSVVKLEYE